MSIDAYSLCPGGSGKKIKFCCGDFLPELQKIDRMIEGEQYLACLQHVDRLSTQELDRDRACLLATRCRLLRTTGQEETVRAAAETFLAKHPDNQIALAEAALSAAPSDALAAFNLLQRAMRAACGKLMGLTYQAMGVVAEVLLQAGFPVAARALLAMQYELVKGEDDQPLELLTALRQSADVPLSLRADFPLAICPKAAPWKDRFIKAMQAVALGDWRTAAERMTALAAEVSSSPAIWRNLAVLRGWLADNAGSAEALRKYAALRAGEENGLEDAVEAEAEAMFLADDPLGDRLEMFNVVWTVKDVERLQEALSSSPRWQPVPFDSARFSDGENPPPRGAYALLDRPVPESVEGLGADAMPCLLGQALLFGRQTDRQAHLEVLGVTADELQTVNQIVHEAAAEAVEPEPKPEVVGHGSATQKLLRAAWYPPRDALPDRLRELLVEHARQAVFNRWPDLKLGVLDGRSPRETASEVLDGRSPRELSGDEGSRLRLLAAIMVLEHWAERLPGEIDFNELRAQLGLPVLGPIDSRNQPLATLPITRLGRLSLDGLSDQDLILAYRRAGAFVVRPALRKFAQAIIDRPSLAGSEERLDAHASLARTEKDMARALEHVEQGRRAADARKESHASWDLIELSFRFAQRDGENSMRLIEHIQDHHLEEPGVGETLTHMLIDVGLLRPDGTPAFGPETAEPAPAETPAAETSELWTPESAKPSGGGKLWTPE